MTKRHKSTALMKSKLFFDNPSNSAIPDALPWQFTGESEPSELGPDQGTARPAPFTPPEMNPDGVAGDFSRQDTPGHSPLEVKYPAVRTRVDSQPGEKAGMMCPLCKRLYPLETNYCRIDGSPLSLTSRPSVNA
ncbi:MAG TPA: hypothetical protein VJX67_18385 [Blastocatellia bacterium]|nr:hypothetical protein [Blastocatellia bacterium]